MRESYSRDSKYRVYRFCVSSNFTFPRREASPKKTGERAYIHTHVCVFVYTYVRYGIRVCMSPYVPRTPPHTNTCVVWGKKGVTSRRHDRCVYSVEEKDGV